MTGSERRIQALRENNPKPVIDMVGRKFAKLTVIERVPRKGRTIWRCRCDCGGETNAEGFNIRAGHVQSCGCVQRERAAAANSSRAKHGHTRHKRSEPVKPSRTYRTWRCMLYRCYGKKAANRKHYGGRGIAVCPQWQGKAGFAKFLKDLGERPDGRTLDRINTDGNYEPGNVQWATPKEQCVTRRKKSPPALPIT